MLSLETRPLSVRSSAGAVSAGGATGCLCKEAQTQMPGGSHLAECRKAPASSTLGGVPAGAPLEGRLPRGSRLHNLTIPPEQWFLSGHLAAFGDSFGCHGGVTVDEAGDAVKCPTARRAAPDLEQVAWMCEWDCCPGPCS